MSISTMAAVWKHSAHSGTELLMLLAIADFADDNGNAHPAVGTLATKCRMTPRNANHILAALKASGELEVRLNEGPKGCNRYRIVLDGKSLKPASPLKATSTLKGASGDEAGFTLKPASSTPEAGFPKALKPASAEPSLNHQEPSDSSRPPKGAVTVGLKVWIDSMKRSGATPIPETDPVFDYASRVGIPREFLRLAWLEFRTRYTQPEAKRYRDWRAVFRKAVRGNWLKLWRIDAHGEYRLTTEGEQARRANEEASPA